MYDRILVPTDGSEGTEAVLDHAFAIAEPYDATVVGLYVVDARVVRSSTDHSADEVRAELEADGEDALDAVADRGDQAGVTVERRTVEGSPSREILAVADDIDADLVVLGSHGKTPREKVQGLGSVSEAVVNEVRRPVMVVALG